MTSWLRRFRALGSVAALLATCDPARAANEGEVIVFAAASLANALQEAGEAFTRQGGAAIKFSFAASSTLAKQIESGARAQLFLSADESWMDYLEKRKLIAPGTRRALLGNRLVLVVPADKAQSLDIAAGSGWLGKLPAGRIATGDPAHVPVGRYAEQALTRLGLWAAVIPRLARADSVRSALVLVERGEAVAGIVYATDAKASRLVGVAGEFPEALHDPIIYPVALLAGEDRRDARRFYEFLLGKGARTIFVAHGFEVR